jgi:5S rRNA maturation endonuclease (ribonuclease M5)
VRLIGEQWQNDGYIYRRLTTLEAHIFNDKLQQVKVPFSDMRLLLRASLELFTDDEYVKFDFTSAEDEFGLSYDAKIVDTAVENLQLPARALEQILVLTEGKTDSRLLRQSLSVLLPHLMHLYSFLDHSTFKVPGGTGEVERLARGLAGANVGNRVVILFDNDTAGTSAAARLRQVNLPKNFRVLTLPHLDIAESYPTLGPTGLIVTDINGKACGIELYCGTAALKRGGTDEFVPVQWTGYDTQRQQYQGEVLDKEAIQTRFLHVLQQSSDAQSTPEFRHMLAVLKLIINAFHQP